MAGESPWLWAPVTTNAVVVASMRLKLNTTGALSIFYVAGARKNEAREGDTLLSCVFVARPVFCRLLLPSTCYAIINNKIFI